MVSTPEDLFARFRDRGDAKALARVFDELAPELLVVAAHLSPRGCEAEDFVQATFLAAMRDKKRFDSARRLMPWLLGILGHQIADARRRRRATDEPVVEPIDARDPARLAEQSELAEALDQALAALPAPYKQALSLRLVHGLTPTEIAHALGCPIATVKTRLARGRETLRNALPAGFALSAAALLSPGRGLASVRAAVLAESGVGAAVGLGFLGGVLMANKVMVGVVGAAVVGMTAWWAAGLAAREHSEDVPRREASVVPIAAASQPRNAPEAAPPVADEPVAGGARTVLATTGSASLRFVWKEDGTPAGDVQVWDTKREAWPGQRQADSEGRLELEELRIGPYVLGVAGSSTVVQLVVEPGRRTEQTVELEGGTVLEGRVVDPAGEPVAAADVWNERPWNAIARSGADGSFRARTAGVGWVWARKNGWTPSPMPWRYTEDGRVDRRPLVLTLGKDAGSLRGLVVDPQERPVAGATVAIVLDERPVVRTTKAGDLPSSRQRLPVLVLRTDASGRFAIDEVPAGARTVHARADGHAPGRTRIEVKAAASLDVRVLLPRGARVRGRVVDQAGGPRAFARIDADVSAEAEWGTAMADPGLSGRYAEFRKWSSLTDGDGRYQLDGIVPGTVSLKVSGQGHQPVTRDALLADGEELVWDVVLASNLTLRGRVVDPQDRPAVGWRIRVQSEDPRVDHSVARSDGWTDAQGCFTAEDLADAEYTVLAIPGQAPQSIGWSAPWARLERVRPGAEEVVLRLAVDPEKPAFVIGRVLLGPDQPCEKFDVCLRHASTKPDVTTLPSESVASSDGRFRVGPLLPGLYGLYLSLAPRSGKSFGLRALAPGQTLDLGEVRFDDQARVRLRLRHPDGAMVTGWDAELRGDYLGRVNEPEADGFLRSPHMNPRSHELRVFGCGFLPIVREVIVLPGEDATLDLVVDRAPIMEFELVVTDRERWLDSAFVRVQDANDKDLEWNIVPVDAGTSFVWRRSYAPGEYRILVSGSTDLAGEERFVVGEGAGRVRVEMRVK